MIGYVDVHTHLTHKDFAGDLDEVIKRAESAGLGAVVVNGLEPGSNRAILKMAGSYPVIKAALGIYPIDGVWDQLPEDFPIKVSSFDVGAEIDFIREQARNGKLVAIGECGLDGYWLGEETYKKQEFVFEALLEIAMSADIPVIIHSRKRERRVIEILKAYGPKKVDFHCYGGKTRLALQVANEHGWYFSIPANAGVNEAFQKLLRELPVERILTETDAPYLAPVRKTRNEPANVVHTVDLLASLRGWNIRKAKSVIWDNYQRLFGPAQT